MLICLASVLRLLIAHAQAQDVPSPEQLARDRTLAALPLMGPRAAVGVGAMLIVATPVALLIGSLATLDLTGCQGVFSDGTYEDCSEQERRQERREERTMNNALGVAISSVVIGTGLLAFGVTRIVQIKGARRRVLRLDSATVAPSSRGVALGLRFRF